MPWKVREPMSERMEFLRRLESGERMAELCREFGISRKTGYKFRERFRLQGWRGCLDESRRPQRSPQRTPPDIEARILAFKDEYPSWGSKKLKRELEVRHPGVRWPASSTISLLLDRHGLVKHRERRRRTVPYAGALRDTTAPNELWCVDFKGEFRLQNREYCYPLTMSDHCSRLLLCCEGLESVRGEGAKPAMEWTFREYGLPEAIRSDNGSPFASVGLAGLSRLSVWWLRLGIVVERIEPGHPEQNGRHERIHLTLKLETTRPAQANALAQQERFDAFRHEYNHERPHEGLDMRRPAEVYQPSPRRYPDELPIPEYPLHDLVGTVSASGHVKIGGRSSRRTVFLSSALAGEQVGLREISPDSWLVTFVQLDLCTVDARTGRLEPR